MTIGAWEIAHVVETDASPGFAWNYWTNVAHWADPPAEFALEGPFAPESQGTTRLPGQEPMYWVIREVAAPNSATIELPVGEGVSVFFKWRVDGLDDDELGLRRELCLQVKRLMRFWSRRRLRFRRVPLTA
jgi:hypothetical protein